MTEAVEKFIPIFVGLLLILRGLFWIVDGKNGNKRSYFFGIAAIVVGIIMFITVFFQVLSKATNQCPFTAKFVPTLEEMEKV